MVVLPFVTGTHAVHVLVIVALATRVQRHERASGTLFAALPAAFVERQCERHASQAGCPAAVGLARHPGPVVA
jgi:hypothetical protein